VTDERPVDHDARNRVRVELGTSFVLEAGAGTGKTTLLIERIVGLVKSGEARLDEIAAVTFTENAAATMKLRLREALERLRSDLAAEEAERERASRAFEMLERAQVSTMKSYARRKSFTVCCRSMMWIPLRAPKMNGRILGFQRLVWWPK